MIINMLRTYREIVWCVCVPSKNSNACCCPSVRKFRVVVAQLGSIVLSPRRRCDGAAHQASQPAASSSSAASWLRWRSSSTSSIIWTVLENDARVVTAAALGLVVVLQINVAKQKAVPCNIIEFIIIIVKRRVHDQLNVKIVRQLPPPNLQPQLVIGNELAQFERTSG